MKDPLPWPDKPVDWNTRTGGYAKDMLLRDYFAAKAMQEFCKEFHDDEEIAKVAYAIADAMLKARAA